MEVALLVVLAIGVGLASFAVGMLLAPLIGRWADRGAEGDDDGGDDD